MNRPPPISPLFPYPPLSRPPAPPLGTPDPDNLLWAEQHGRIIVTEDRRTMPVHLADHLQAGRHSPGVFIRSEEHTSELQSRLHLVCRLLLEKKIQIDLQDKV